MWTPFFLATLLSIALGQEQFPQAYGGLSRLLLFLGLAAPLSTTILGWLATAQIRRTGGKLRGLELAVFDGLFFPLAGLDLLLAFFWLLLAKTVAHWRGLNGSLFVNFWDLALWMALLIVVAAAVDILIVRRIWRWVNRSKEAGPFRRPQIALHALSIGFLTLGLITGATATLLFCCRNVDNINQPFVDDPQAIGQWTSVDFVGVPEDFKPGAQSWQGDVLMFQKFSILPGGRTSYRWLTWTRGKIINPSDRTAASYEIKNIGGTNFMFVEWKNGDYIIFHSKPALYVLRQTTPPSAELEFRLVAAEGDSNTPADELADPNDRTGQTKLRILKEVLLDSSAVASASLETGQSEDKTISVVLKSDATRKFSDITAAGIGRRLAIVWRGRVLSAPVIRARITGPAVSVTGKMSDAECQVLLDLLNFKSKPSATGQVLPVSSAPDVILTTNGLISWWPAEGNAGDIAGTNDGVLCGGVGFARGIVGQAFDFRGKAQKVIIPDNESLKLTNSLTIEGWIYVRGPGFILFRGDNRPGLDPYALQVNPGGSLAFAIYSEANEAATVYGRIPLKQWIHAAATLNGSSGNMRLYVDGVLVAEKSTIIRPLRDLDPQANPGLAIGGHSGSDDYSPFDGMVDELSLYDRALGEDEIRAIANAGKAGKRKMMASFDEAAINSAINNAQERSQKRPDPAAGVEKAAISSAEAWLNAIDAGRYSESWKDADLFFQGAVTGERWAKSMESFRKPLGSLISRNLKSARPMTEIPGAPDGQYALMQFDTSFTSKKSAVETVTFMLEKDGQWRAAGYFIE